MRWKGLLAAALGTTQLAAAEAPPDPARCAEPTPEAAAAVLPVAAWHDPPAALRPVARWWWPGGSVTREGVETQLRRIADAGFGAVELQPLLLGLGDADLAADPKLRTVGEPAFRKSVAHAAAHAQRLGLAFDLTLGSGWPGGLPTAPANAERELRMATRDVTGPARFDAALPGVPEQSYRSAVEWVLDVLGPGLPDTRLVAVLAARVGPERDGLPVLDAVRVLEGWDAQGRLTWDVPDGRWRLFAFHETATSHFVMGGAFPGAESDALVVDHLSRRGADALLAGYADPLLDAVGEGRVREVFVDSFELLGELPFTTGFLTAFRQRAGYDLTPHLPLVFRNGGEAKYAEMMDLFGRGGGPLYTTPDPETAQRVREDYEAVRRALFEERFVARFVEWAHARKVTLRLQAHGGHGDVLDTYARADVPESEALFAGGSFDFLKLAASAARVAGRRFASSESFITLRLFGTRLDDDELRLLAGRAHSAGINRLAFHGVPYPHARADGNAWYPFSGGFGRILAGPLPMSYRFDADALRALPAFNRFLGRLTAATSHGEPVADVAWLHADPQFPDAASLQLGRVEPHDGESATTRALRARGLVYDRVSRRMLAGAQPVEGGFAVGAQRYRALLLDPIEFAEPELVERVAALATSGVPVVALGALPRRAPGLREAAVRDARVRDAVAKLAERVVRAGGDGALEAVLAARVRGSLVEPPEGARLAVSLDRRRSNGGETLLVVNESWDATRASLRFTRAGGALVRWDPWTGCGERLRESVAPGDVVSLELAPAASVVLTLEARPASSARSAG